ncbi:TspO/MBR family protein [Qipengyuania sp.]|uniref:TspO/MBR family protein n=1 Tax=Qipengyuania sp. TaxID=2004515 RepID=UPI00351855B9
MNMLASRGQLRASFIRWALFTVPLVVLLGFLAGQLGSPDTAWFASLEKPAIFPEPKWFGIVWTVLYVMIGFAVAIVASAWGARGRSAALGAFAVHFVLNLAWSYVFFGAQQITGALYLLVGIVLTLLVVIALFWRVRRGAALLLLPYLVWVCFASVLNYQFLQLNPGADGGEIPDGAVERVRI